MLIFGFGLFSGSKIISFLSGIELVDFWARVNSLSHILQLLL